VILWIAAGLALIAEITNPGQGMGTLAIAVVAVILINAIFSHWQEYRAEKAVAALQALLPHDVRAMRTGRVRIISAFDLVPGDVIRLGQGDIVPADCRVLQAFDLRVNTATLTGEPVPRVKTSTPTDESDPLQSRNIVLAGMSIAYGDATALVFATGMRTEFGRISRLTEAAQKTVSPLQKEITRLSRVIAALASLVGIAFLAAGTISGLSAWESAVFAIGIIVANVPEGLLPTVTLAMAMASQRLARLHVIVRHLPAVETLGSATIICSDKTGTLTENRMEAVELLLGAERCTPDDLAGCPALVERHRRLFEATVLCENVTEAEYGGRVELVGDPMETALVRLGRRLLGSVASGPRVDEIPFDSDRKRLSTVHQTSTGRVLYVKGALETVLPLCRSAQWGAEIVPLTADLTARLERAQHSFATDGLRVLAFAHRMVPEGCARDGYEHDLVFGGLVGLADPPRPEVPSAIRTCHAAGIRVIMITGDHPETARAIARQIGLVTSADPVVITGAELRRLSDTQLQLALDAPEIIFARVGADQKLRIVATLQRKRHVVAVTGDGVNDAPALRAADIGIAMGATGTDVAREAADMVLMDDNFANIVAAIREGRGIFDNIRKFLTYILTSNVPEIVPYLAFVLLRIPLPLTILQILAVDLGTDIVPALGLGAEPPEPEVMQRPPRSSERRLIDRFLLLRAYLFLGLIEAAAAMSAYFFILQSSGWHWGDMLSADNLVYRQATTACLSAIVIMQVANVYLCRSERRALTPESLLNNRVILAGIATEIVAILLIDYSVIGQRIFATEGISSSAWILVIPFAAVMIALEQARQAVVRSWSGLVGCPARTARRDRSS
jgi:calcium-translocating P-type ATPase